MQLNLMKLLPRIRVYEVSLGERFIMFNFTRFLLKISLIHEYEHDVHLNLTSNVYKKKKLVEHMSNKLLNFQDFISRVENFIRQRI